MDSATEQISSVPFSALEKTVDKVSQMKSEKK